MTETSATAPVLSAFADYHVHTPLCHHAQGWPEDFAQRAIELGLGELGFADHNPMPTQFDDWRMSIDDLPRYIDVVTEARARFPQLNIRIGLECDFIPGYEAWIEELAGKTAWDFFIGSVHYLPGADWALDDPQHVSRFRGKADIADIWASYWRTYERGIRSGLFDFMAHPDLPKKFGFRPEGDLRKYYEPAITALVEKGVAFEINTAGLRKQCRELYPASDFLALAAEAGATLLINSDSHAPAELCAGYAEAAAAARAAGFTHTARFALRKHTLVPLP